MDYYLEAMQHHGLKESLPILNKNIELYYRKPHIIECLTAYIEPSSEGPMQTAQPLS
jgi:hypothetical protein